MRGVFLTGLVVLASMLFFSGLFTMQLVILLGLSLSSLAWKVYIAPNALGLATGLLLSFWIRNVKQKREVLEQRIRRQSRNLEAVYKRLQTEKESAEKLAEEFRTFFNAVEQSANYVVITDVQGNIEYINPAFLEATGFGLNEVLGKNPRIWKSDRQSANFYRILWETILAGQVWQGEVCNKKKDGSGYWALATISPIRNEKNQIANFIAIYEDITQKKAMQEGIALSFENARAASQSKANFISAMSHELKTPLNAILGFSELLADELSDAKSKEYLGHIQKGGRYLLDLITDILELARAEDKLRDTELEAILVQDILQEAAQSIEPLLKQNKLYFELSVAKEPCWIRANPLRLRQALLNLLSNAIKYNQAGGIVILKGSLLESGLVRISVQDTGLGIPEEKQRHLFEPFNRLGKDRSGIEGTGLGLALTKELVEGMGGSLGFFSRSGKGSLFWMDFPVAGDSFSKEASAAKEGSVLEQKSVPEKSQAPLQGLSLLLIEDDATSRLLMKALVEKAGGRMQAVSSLAEAKEALEQAEGLSVVLSDLNLPDGNALDFLEQIRGNPKTAALPFVLLTADSDPLLRQKCLDKGADAFLAKPVESQALFDLLSGFR